MEKEIPSKRREFPFPSYRIRLICLAAAKIRTMGTILTFGSEIRAIWPVLAVGSEIRTIRTILTIRSEIGTVWAILAVWTHIGAILIAGFKIGSAILAVWSHIRAPILVVPVEVRAIRFILIAWFEVMILTMGAVLVKTFLFVLAVWPIRVVAFAVMPVGGIVLPGVRGRLLVPAPGLGVRAKGEKRRERQGHDGK